MIGSPRYLAIQAATEAATTTEPERNAVADAAVADLAKYRADTAEAKIAELYTTCSRCRTRPCTAMWDDFRVCDECSQILTGKYDRQPVEPRGTYKDGYHRGQTDAFRAATEWARNALIESERPF